MLLLVRYQSVIVNVTVGQIPVCVVVSVTVSQIPVCVVVSVTVRYLSV